MEEDFIEPDARVGPSPMLTRAVAMVRSFASDAQRIESDGVTRKEVDRLASAGVLSAAVVDGWTPAQVREVHEQLAGASGALWFVVAQHRSPSESARASDNVELRAQWASALASGKLLGAVAFAHLRRPGPPTVTATRAAGGWRLSGRLDWITSWGLADALLLMAETSEGSVVQALVPASERPGLATTGALALAAMQGTSTVGAVLDEMWVGDAEVARVLPKIDWSAADALHTANAPPAVFGLTRAALDALHASGVARGSKAVRSLAHEWRSTFISLRARAYELVDDVAPAEAIAERTALRAQITKMAQEVPAALIAAQAGRAMLLSSPEQRWAREALFALVQAQTQATREALIATYRP